ncbi:MAG: thymidine kinase [Pyrinomonadaceae bacterium]|nr:thymidine kinase [Pyrinomonadaceae bacterium]MCX7640015.1 thymidine kinase [Pyrinomonadaceae bacterium]MDW8304187.1 thymidine kinase [Acidobacteriota bacterium]
MIEEFVYGDDREKFLTKENGRVGWIEVIVGSMFSGKSEELIRRLKRAQIAKQKVQVFKPKIDNRYSVDEIISHSGLSHISKPVSNTAEMMSLIEPDTQVVGIDEGQFFDMELVSAANDLANRGKRVIIAGLDQDYTGKPFEPMPQLLAIAEFITKTHAICMKCGATANYSQRISASTERIEVGAADKYEARCRRCFVPYPEPK